MQNAYVIQRHTVDSCFCDQWRGWSKNKKISAAIWEQRLIFQKPVDLEALRDSLGQALHRRRLERRKKVRVGLRVPVEVERARREWRVDFIRQFPSTAENVSKSGFLCACAVVLTIGFIVDVFMLSPEKEHVGKARVVRAEWTGTQ